MQPLDDRDVAPWADDQDDEDAETYKQEREVERMDEHFAPSEPY